jgi:signal transduction histidine kinase/ActR/RegA family two-component response regulator
MSGQPGITPAAGAACEPLFCCGEVGARLRTLEGSCTSLGEPRHWPESLHVAAGLCLTSRLPAQVWWGPELALLYNDACIPLLGAARHPAMLGRPAREAWAGIWEKLAPLATQVLSSGRPAWSGNVLTPLSGPPAEPRDCMGFSLRPLLGRSGAVLGLYCVCHEGPEAAQTRAPAATADSPGGLPGELERLSRELDALREAHRQKDAFLATLAHELRNPLFPIRNAVRILRLSCVNEPQLADARGIIERQTEQLVRLVDDLMEISRIGRGRIQLQLKRVDLRCSIGTAVEASRSLVDGGGHTLVVQLPGEPLPVEGDPARLSQIFANLLNNAAKYTPAGGRIELAAHIEAAAVAVRVTDTGLGIPPHMLERIFDMFAQVDPSQPRTQGGLGIGLTVARQLAQLHGGRIEATSEGTHRGSTFTVYLPLVRGGAVAVEARTTREEPTARRAAPCRVVIADDHPDAAESLSILLTMGGHTVRTAGDGLAAVQLAQELQPAVVLLDIGMPGLDGYAAAERIRMLPQGERILLLALTGWGQDSDRERAAQAGFDYHLTKPADPELLERILAEHFPTP